MKSLLSDKIALTICDSDPDLLESTVKELDAAFGYRDSHLLRNRLVRLLRRRIQIEEMKGGFDYEGRLRLALHFSEARKFHAVYKVCQPMIDRPDGLEDTADSHFNLYQEAVEQLLINSQKVCDEVFTVLFVRTPGGGIRSLEKVNDAYCSIRGEPDLYVNPGDFWQVRYMGQNRDRSMSYVEPLRIVYALDGRHLFEGVSQQRVVDPTS